jgi:hypothetical protein
MSKETFCGFFWARPFQWPAARRYRRLSLCRRKPGSMRSTITVENRNLADINVYVVVNGARYRLGSVQPLRSQALRIPRVISLPSDIEVYASAEASVIDERQRFSSPRFSF